MNEVEAVKTEKQRDQVEAHLLESGQIYFDVWKLGVNLALRISDLLSITMADVAGMDPAAPAVTITEGKTGKKRKIMVNSGALEIMQRRLADYPKDKFLFQSKAFNLSKRAPAQAIQRQSVSRVFKEVGQSVAPKVALGTHSMRKTRGWAMHDAGMSIERICKVFNHSNTSITMRYIGLTQTDIDNSFTDLVL